MDSKVFQNKIRRWYRTHHRNDLPWRNTTHPYKILVSEVMLQQTQVVRVVPYYTRFMKRFPTPRKLAAAPLGDVLEVWSGLGYNRRAKYLWQAAKFLVGECGGRFPLQPGELERLPGVGPYTARAVACFSRGTCEPFLETNIRRVILHFFFPRKSKVSDEQILSILRKVEPKKNLRDWYLALMDYGATALADVSNPNKRSRHYTTQSKFKGSNRYYRGAVMHTLLGAPRGMNAATLAKAVELATSSARFRSVLGALRKEGLVQCPAVLTKQAQCAIIRTR